MEKMANRWLGWSSTCPTSNGQNVIWWGMGLDGFEDGCGDGDGHAWPPAHHNHHQRQMRKLAASLIAMRNSERKDTRTRSCTFCNCLADTWNDTSWHLPIAAQWTAAICLLERVVHACLPPFLKFFSFCGCGRRFYIRPGLLPQGSRKFLVSRNKQRAWDRQPDLCSLQFSLSTPCNKNNNNNNDVVVSAGGTACPILSFKSPTWACSTSPIYATFSTLFLYFLGFFLMFVFFDFFSARRWTARGGRSAFWGLGIAQRLSMALPGTHALDM